MIGTLFKFFGTLIGIFIVIGMVLTYWVQIVLLAIAGFIVLMVWSYNVDKREQAEKQRVAALAAEQKQRDEEAARQERIRSEWKAELLRRVVLYNRSLSVSNFRVRMPHNADDFEEVCAEFLRIAGYSDAGRTSKGPDGGVDVVASGVVAQCKMYSNQIIPASPVRELFACKVDHGAQAAFFFVYGLGYSDDAIKTGKRLGVRLLYLDVDLMAFREVGDYNLSAGQPITEEEHLSMMTDWTVSCPTCPNTLSFKDPNCANNEDPDNAKCPMVRAFRCEKLPPMVGPIRR
jgi:hypothetical protein